MSSALFQTVMILKIIDVIKTWLNDFRDGEYLRS